MLKTLAALLMFIVGPAFAQDTAVVSQSSWLSGVWEIVQPIAAVLATIVGPAIAAFIAGQLIKLLGITDKNAQLEVEKKVRDALHNSALNAVKYAVAKRVGPLGDLVKGHIPADLIQTAVDYVRSKNPDAAAGVDDDNLVEIILSKMIDVQATMNSAAPKPAAAKPAGRK